MSFDDKFNYDSIPLGFYDDVINNGNSIRRCWHIEKFDRILASIEPAHSLLDIGCFAGTFLSLIPRDTITNQLGIDILQKQIAYASGKYETSFRKFKAIKTLRGLKHIDGKFDYITLIEVIEHLTRKEISSLFADMHRLLKKDGHLLASTPNYTSAWPLLEYMLNRHSDLSYQEQHITRFNYFSMIKKLKKIVPDFDEKWQVNFVTTSHFITPFFAFISLKYALKLSKIVPHHRWYFPFGNLIIFKLGKK